MKRALLLILALFSGNISPVFAQDGPVILDYNGVQVYVMPADLDQNAIGGLDLTSVCADVDYSGYTDWRLPTKEELVLLYENRESIGGFSDNWYWISTDEGMFEAWAVNFEDGSAELSHKLGENFVRLVRTD